MKFLVHIIIAIPLLAGCASTQLNHNTLEIAGTVDDLLANQISHNIAKFLRDENAIPSQVSIPSGSVSTTNQVGTNWADPLTKAVTITNQVVSGGNFTKNQITGTAQNLTTANVITPSATDQWSQNWSLAPVTDSDQMRRLAALYRYVTDPRTVDLCRDYPLVSTQASVGASTPGSSDDENVWKQVAHNAGTSASAYKGYLWLYSKHAWAARRLLARIKEPPLHANEDYEKAWDQILKADDIPSYATYVDIYASDPPPKNEHVAEARERLMELLKAAGKADENPPSGSATQTSDGPITVTANNSMFLREPSCIICSKKANEKNISRSPKVEIERNSCSRHGKADLYVNPRLMNDWLIYGGFNDEYYQVTPLGPVPTSSEGLCSIGHSGGIHLYTRDTRAYNEFILFVMEATAQGSTAGQSGKANANRNAGAAVAPASAAVVIGQGAL